MCKYIRVYTSIYEHMCSCMFMSYLLPHGVICGAVELHASVSAGLHEFLVGKALHAFPKKLPVLPLYVVYVVSRKPKFTQLLSPLLLRIMMTILVGSCGRPYT